MPLPRYSIIAISAAALAYELLLMRLFSVIQWHHLAYMVISLALLGYGMSGTFLSLFQRTLLAHYPYAYLINLILFSISSVGCYLFAQSLPLNPEEMLWSPIQLLWLSLTYLLLALPFFFAANAIALTFSAFKQKIGTIYAFDLLGAGIGSLGIVALLFYLFPDRLLLLIGTFGLLTAALAWWELSLHPRFITGILLVIALLCFALGAGRVTLSPSPYKPLSQALNISDIQIISEHTSPLGQLAVVESPTIPWRYAPGLSLYTDLSPPLQLAIFTDGGSMTALNHFQGDLNSLAYLDQSTSALPYHLNPPQQVLIVGTGGGVAVQQAYYHNINQIDAIELNPQMTKLLQSDYLRFTGNLFNDPSIHLYTGEARGFIVDHPQHYDLINIPPLDSFTTASSGLYALNESYLYTREAIVDYLDKLTPNGYLSSTRWVNLPPRDTLKLFATAIDALKQRGITAPSQHLILIRSWQTTTLLVKNSPIQQLEISALKAFCQQRGFDLAYYPGIEESETNQFNILSAPYFYQGAMALLGNQREQFIEAYKFNLQAAEDNRPYFFHFFKWQSLPEILTLREHGGASLLEWGYLMLIATLLQSITISFLLILLPILIWKREKQHEKTSIKRHRVLLYFSLIGLAFMLIEIPFIQKFTLFLHHPLYAAAVVISAFLIFAGLGSQFSQKGSSQGRQKALVTKAIIAIVVLGGIYLLSLPELFSLLASWPTWSKSIVTLMMIAPLAFCMGMPFPLAMAQLGKQNATLIPWAWGINGCTSVIAVTTATLLSIEMGFNLVIVLALLLYLLAIALFPASTIDGSDSK